MLAIVRQVVLWTVALLAVVSVTGCGSGAEVPRYAVAKVGDVVITKSTADHWMSAIAADGNTSANHPAPEVPDYPSYGRCVAYRQAFTAKRLPGQPPPTLAEFNSECAQEFRKLKLKALYFLISAEWLSGEASELRVKVTDAEVTQELALFKRRGFSSEDAYLRYVASSRFSPEDMRLRMRLLLLATKIQQQVEAEIDARHPTAQLRKRSLKSFGARFEKKWIARTTCRAGYVVPICRQYQKPTAPLALSPPSIPLAELAN